MIDFVKCIKTTIDTFLVCDEDNCNKTDGCIAVEHWPENSFAVKCQTLE